MVLAERIARILEDGIVDSKERQELFSLLAEVSGNPQEAMAMNLSTALPLDDPQPEVTFDGRTFCLTGQFFFGTRERCAEAIQSR